jgi:transcriptional regulator with XRE-family HTH domain
VPDDETFGQRLRRLRTEQRIGSNALAKAVGVSGPAIRMMETGVTKQARLDIAILLAEALGVTPRYLAFGGPSFRGSARTPRREPRSPVPA